MHDETFRCMGTQVRLIISDDASMPAATSVAADVRRWLERYDEALSRFRPDSELCALNADPRTEVPVSAMVLTAVAGALRAAAMTGGLVDPTLGAAIVRAGYAASLAGIRPASLSLALAAAPPRRPAQPDPAGRWTAISVNREAGTVARPAGLVVDTGGSGKGLAADVIAHRLRGHSRWVVDCGGDIRLGGAGAAHEVIVDHPITGTRAYVLHIDDGAVATSGLSARLWRRPDGTYAHHLLDPSTGQPAWTGLISATALAPTALEAEALAKHALLGGPDQARRILARRGGVLVHDAGQVEPVGRARSAVVALRGSRVTLRPLPDVQRADQIEAA